MGQLSQSKLLFCLEKNCWSSGEYPFRSSHDHRFRSLWTNYSEVPKSRNFCIRWWCVSIDKAVMQSNQNYSDQHLNAKELSCGKNICYLVSDNLHSSLFIELPPYSCLTLTIWIIWSIPLMGLVPHGTQLWCSLEPRVFIPPPLYASRPDQSDWEYVTNQMRWGGDYILAEVAPAPQILWSQSLFSSSCARTPALKHGQSGVRLSPGPGPSRKRVSRFKLESSNLSKKNPQGWLQLIFLSVNLSICLFIFLSIY